MKMKKFSFYEQVGVIMPGAVFLFGLMFCVQQLKNVFAKDGITVGGLGVFVIISYAAGHLLAAVGNGVENAYWGCRGGMPSNWIIGTKPRLLSPVQVAKVESLVAARLGLVVEPLSKLTIKGWSPIFRQIYSDVEKHGKPERGDIFNGIYGLNRGLCAATVSLALTLAIQSIDQWPAIVGLLVVSCVYLYRMHRFGVHYAREIYNQFLLLPLEPGKPKAAKRVKADKGGETAKAPPSA